MLQRFCAINYYDLVAVELCANGISHKPLVAMVSNCNACRRQKCHYTNGVDSVMLGGPIVIFYVCRNHRHATAIDSLWKHFDMTVFRNHIMHRANGFSVANIEQVL